MHTIKMFKPFTLYSISNDKDIANKDGLRWRLLAMVISLIVAMGIMYGAIVVMPSAWASRADIIFVIIFFASFFVVSKFIRSSLKDWIRVKDTTGKIYFNENFIEATELKSKIEINAIERVDIVGDYYQGFVIGARDLSHNGLYNFCCTLKEGTQTQLQFVVYNKQEFSTLIEFVSYVYSKNTISIIEKIGIERNAGFLLRHDRTYKEIQELKSNFQKLRKI